MRGIGGIGRHAGFRFLSPRGMGSSPIFRIEKERILTEDSARVRFFALGTIKNQQKNSQSFV